MNKKNLKETLIEILKIIKFDGNKEDFSNGLVNLVYVETLMELVNLIAAEKGKSIFQEINSTSEPQELHKIIIEHIGEEKLAEKLQENSTKKLEDYLTEISSTISDKDKEKILALMAG